MHVCVVALLLAAVSAASAVQFVIDVLILVPMRLLAAMRELIATRAFGVLRWLLGFCFMDSI
jgi:hypothetical protein